MIAGPSGFRLELGGVRFRVDSPPRIPVREDDELYSRFLSPAVRGEEADVHARLQLNPAPDPESMPLLFDTEESWFVHGEAGRLIFRLRGPGGASECLWTACVSSSDSLADRVSIHCGPRLLDHGVLTNPVHYPLDQLLLGLALADRRGLLLHAAGLVSKGRGFLFAGRSGAGKTTLMRLCETREDLEGLSDDRIIVRVGEGEVRAYGTPWAGEGRIAENRSAPLAAVVFLHHAELNELRNVSSGEALTRLLPVSSVPWYYSPAAEAMLETVGRLVERVPCFDLRFRPEPAALDALEPLLDGAL